MSFDISQEFPDTNVQDRVRKMANRHMKRLQVSDDRVCNRCGKYYDLMVMIPIANYKYHCRECSVIVRTSRIPGQGC